MLLVPERRRSRRPPTRDPRPRRSRRRSAGEADETASVVELAERQDRFVGFDEEGDSPANIAASGASH